MLLQPFRHREKLRAEHWQSTSFFHDAGFFSLWHNHRQSPNSKQQTLNSQKARDETTTLCHLLTTTTLALV